MPTAHSVAIDPLRTEDVRRNKRDNVDLVGSGEQRRPERCSNPAGTHGIAYWELPRPKHGFSITTLFSRRETDKRLPAKVIAGLAVESGPCRKRDGLTYDNDRR